MKGAASGRLMFSLLGGELNFINLGRSDDPGLEDDLVHISVSWVLTTLCSAWLCCSTVYIFLGQAQHLLVIGCQIDDTGPPAFHKVASIFVNLMCQLVEISNIGLILLHVSNSWQFKFTKLRPPWNRQSSIWNPLILEYGNKPVCFFIAFLTYQTWDNMHSTALL